ncbi:MAG: trehalose operon repressor [Liquorilactobacillus sp.]|uniref:trehalose operon repressor n=1 Tax=Liquorilactobacillus sp. TaxID=2767923 RepID=UPI0039EA45CE
MQKNTNKQNIIAKDIAEKIHHGLYSPKKFLPSEHQLCDLYGTSRETIRKSLDQLTELGLIQKIKGRGSLVLDIQKFTFPISGITSFKELNNSLSMHASTKVLKLEKRKIPTSLIKEITPPTRDAFYIERLRLIGNEPAVLDIDYLLSPPVTELPVSVAEDSIYAYLENELSLEISYATKEITVETVSKAISSNLKLNSDNIAVLVKSFTYLANTNLLQITESYHNPEKFKFIDFARRRKVMIHDELKEHRYE